jgi:membrane protein
VRRIVDAQRYLRGVDEFQQRHRWLAFPVGVVKNFSDDQGGNLAGLIAYYGFLSLFPLLLTFFTVLGFVLHGHPGIQHDLKTSALSDFPIIGDQISRNVTSVRGNGLGLAIGIIGTFWGGLGVANAAQNAMDRVWDVPITARPGFLPRVGRSSATIGTIGVGIIVTTLLGGIGSGSGGLGLGLRAAAVVVSILLNVGLFVVAFRVLTADDVAWHDLIPGAIFAAAAWEILQSLGGLYVSHALRGMSQTYGLFAIVLGLLAWLHLQAQVVVYAAEINVVRARRLWPRSILPPPKQPHNERGAPVEER